MPNALWLQPNEQVKTYYCQNCCDRFPEAVLVVDEDSEEVEEDWSIFCKLCFMLYVAEIAGNA